MSFFMVIYRKEQGFTNLAHYTDDGDSGTLFLDEISADIMYIFDICQCNHI